MTDLTLGQILSLIAVIGLFTEPLTEVVKLVFGALKRDLAEEHKVLVTIIFGLLLAFAFRLDCLRIVADWTGGVLYFPWWVGTVLSGLLGGRLSNIFHDLATRLGRKGEIGNG